MATLKITRTAQAAGRLELALEGRLTQAYVGLLQDVCAETRAAALRLDLSGVAFVDSAGVRALIALERDGALLHGGSSLVHELLQEGRS